MNIRMTLLLFLFLMPLAMSQPPTPTQAATITVTTTDDEVNNDGDCSLREAIIAANTDAAVDACPAGDGADHIELPAGVYTLTITGANNDDATRGDLDILDELTITGQGRASTIIDANGDDRALHILPEAASVEISRLTVRGSHPSHIGAILVESNLNLTSSRVSENADIGIAVYASGVLNVTNSRIYDNEQGGLLLTLNATATVLNSTISGNSGYGGAGISNAGYLFVVNSTISDNNASNNGGGIYNSNQLADTVLLNATVTGNSADASDGGGIDGDWGRTTVKNSIIAGNLRDGGTQPSDCSGSVESEGYNLIQSTAGCTITGDTANDINGVDPMLGPLQDNGGGTVTHALLAGSPAIDAADPAGCEDAIGTLLTTDQRGYVRPVDGGSGDLHCDIGAYEYASGGTRPSRLVVTHTDDDGDTNAGDALCDADPTLAGDQCTLRAAIEEINALGPGQSPLRINFNISGGLAGTFIPSTPLPEINVPVNIDGVSQPDASCPTPTTPADLKIVLDGSNTPFDVSGLVLGPGSDGSTIRGLVVGEFGRDGIVIESDGNTLYCNHLGVAADGISPMGNNRYGLLVQGNENLIGDLAPGVHANVVSDNGVGVFISGDRNNVTGNIIGATADGMSALPNSHGIAVFDASSNLIGIGPNTVFHTTPAISAGAVRPNLIGGNDGYGILLFQAQDMVIFNNRIGVAADGVTALPNAQGGINVVSSSTDIQIGSVTPGDGNVIANNGPDGGVALQADSGQAPVQISIRGNAIVANQGLGIDLGPTGVNPNDAGDTDGGENNGQNYPVLQAAPNSTFVSGELDSAAGATFQIDLYRNEICDRLGHGQGQQYLDSIEVTTDGSGQGDFSVELKPPAVSPGDFVTATATDAAGNTSEFSACVQLDFVPPPTATPTVTGTPPPTPTVTSTPDPDAKALYLPFIGK